MWTRIKDAVAKGRFLPLGGMWVESDTVMPSGEAIVRQFSQGQRFFEREFGIRSKGVWLPDSFGYSPALPQLVRRAGFDWFFTQKISWNQVNVFPHHTFWWEGIDGSRVLTHFPPMDTYNSQLSGEELAKATHQFRESRRASGSIAPVGFGDGGGGTTREMTGRAKRLADLEGSAKVRWEHPDAFFERAREELTAHATSDSAVWVGELYLELHRATLTSQHKTKQGNRRNEQLLVEAEAWAATASARTGADYPYDELDALWQQVLLLQFHDILPGTSVAWVHREAMAQHAAITEGAQAIIERSLRALVGEGDTALRANPAVFAQAGVPALGVALAAAPTSAPSTLTELPDGGYVLANDLVRVTLDAAGHVTSAVDLASGRDAVAPGREAERAAAAPGLPEQVGRLGRGPVLPQLGDRPARGREGHRRRRGRCGHGDGAPAVLVVEPGAGDHARAGQPHPRGRHARPTGTRPRSSSRWPSRSTCVPSTWRRRRSSASTSGSRTPTRAGRPPSSRPPCTGGCSPRSRASASAW